MTGIGDSHLTWAWSLLSDANKIGVNLFVLVTGYFLVKGRFSWKKVVLLLAEVMFYNYLSRFLAAGCNPPAFFKSLTLADVFPTLFGAYWFTTAYILLYLISPYLAKGFRALERDEAIKLIMIVVALWSVLPTVMMLSNDKNNAEAFLFYNRFVWMMVLFCIGGFARLYGAETPILQKKPRLYVLLALTVFVTVLLFMLGVELHPHFAGLIGIRSARLFWPPNTVPTLVISALLFMAFARLKMPCIPWVNRIASTTLGVYLLHDGKLQSIIWRGIFDMPSHMGSSLLLLWILAAASIVFAVGVVVDLLRQLPERWLSRGLDAIGEKLRCITG